METFSEVRKYSAAAASGNEPTKCVKSNVDMQAWHRSEAFCNILGFINGISTAIQGKSIRDEVFVSPIMEKLLSIIHKLNLIIDQTPPIDQPQRFGNKAYRTWLRKVNHDVFMWLQEAVPEEKCNILNELGFYLCESFGNGIRIDYGTGHELSFVFFLCGLYKAEILEETDNLATALRLFNGYLLLVRRLQQTYRMEPAGSQGVWSLDDYQFVPFIWGSAQLAYNAPFDPQKFLDEEIIAKYKDEYMFIGCIDYICQVKTGHFAEHSNQLWSISAVQSWAKINNGLVKMYQKEILSKFPIIQHVYFGHLMSFDEVTPGTAIQPARFGLLPAVASPKVQSFDSGLDAPRLTRQTKPEVKYRDYDAEETEGEVELEEYEGELDRDVSTEDTGIERKSSTTKSLN